jgi:hypothetical protein
VIRHRCGDEIADQVVSVDTLQMVMNVIAAMQDRIEELTLMVEGRVVRLKGRVPCPHSRHRLGSRGGPVG